MIGAIATWARMVRLSHTVFALPFAASGATLAAIDHDVGWTEVLWIGVCMVAARNAAMGFNRLVDHAFDARNPRTAGRELPRGALSRSSVWAFTIVLCALFVFAAFRLGPLCGWLSFPALAIVLGYSWTKRFTWASHAVLGLGLAVAPVGGWLAVAGRFDPIAWLLAVAVLAWVAGFDVIYACQDEEFDRASGLHSVPARFGTARALWIARLLHLAAVGALVAVGRLAGLGPVYWVGMAVIVMIFAWEHRLVRHDDLSRLGTAFFTMNGVISVVYFVVVWLAVVAFPSA